LIEPARKKWFIIEMIGKTPVEGYSGQFVYQSTKHVIVDMLRKGRLLYNRNRTIPARTIAFGIHLHLNNCWQLDKDGTPFGAELHGPHRWR